MVQPLTLSYFEKLKPGTVLMLHSFSPDNGRDVMCWIHDRLEGERVFGRLLGHGDLYECVGVSDYLYECDAVVCFGTSADAVFDEAPEEAWGPLDPDEDDDPLGAWHGRNE